MKRYPTALLFRKFVHTTVTTASTMIITIGVAPPISGTICSVTQSMTPTLSCRRAFATIIIPANMNAGIQLIRLRASLMSRTGLPSILTMANRASATKTGQSIDILFTNCSSCDCGAAMASTPGISQNSRTSKETAATNFSRFPIAPLLSESSAL